MPSVLAMVALCALTADASHGDSAYGHWLDDTFGNPAFYYTGGGSAAPAAIFPTGPNALLHSAGNDRVSALLFSDGSLTLRQDEGGPKLLHGFNASPPTLQFRGGVGYLSSPAQALACSAVAGSVGLPPALPLNLTLGMGYATKHAPLFNHTVLAPFGSTSVVLSIVSLGAAAASGGAPLAWTEVWASGDRWEMGWGADKPLGGTNATAWQAAWAHNFSLLATPQGLPVGLVDAASCSGAAPPRRPRSAPPTPSPHDPEPRPTFLVCLSCLLPSPAFSLRSFTTRAAQLYCAGGEGGAGCSGSGGEPSVESPLAPGVGRLAAGLDNSTLGGGQASVLALQVVGFEPGGAPPPLAFLVGYLTTEQTDACDSAGRSLSDCALQVAQQFAVQAALEPARTALAWQRGANDLEFGEGAYTPASSLGARAAAAQDPTAPPAAPAAAAAPLPRGWEGREAAWHSYSLRAALSYDTFFNDFTLNQFGNYLLVSGYSAAARDPLAHVQGLAWAGSSAAPFVPAVLRTTLAQVRGSNDTQGHPAGSLKWGQAAFGLQASQGFNQSDFELAFLLTLSQYVLGTRDTAPLQGAAGEGAWAAFLHHRDVISVGEHSLARLLLSDHNDGLLGGLGLALTPEIMAQGESGMNGGLAAYALELYAEALELLGGGAGAARAGEARAAGNAQRAAVAAQWATSPANSSAAWYPRAWLGPKLGWRGSPATDGVLWTETQAWALLGRVPWAGSSAGNGSSARAEALVATLAAAPLALNPFGALNTYPDATVDGGVGYGGVWACGGTALVAALGLRGWGGLALQQWRKASLAAHAAAYPGIYFGVTSGPDVVNSAYAAAHGGVPGSTRCAWNSPGGSPAGCQELAAPILNSWPHTLGTYPLPALAGVEFTANGLQLAPTIPASEGSFTVYTPLVSLARQGGEGCAYAGHWAPNATAVGGGAVSLRLVLPPADLAQCATIAVNGGAGMPVTVQGGAVVVQATLQPVQGVPMLTWSTV